MATILTIRRYASKLDPVDLWEVESRALTKAAALELIDHDRAYKEAGYVEIEYNAVKTDGKIAANRTTVKSAIDASMIGP
jgi:hypothetical protein